MTLNMLTIQLDILRISIDNIETWYTIQIILFKSYDILS